MSPARRGGMGVPPLDDLLRDSRIQETLLEWEELGFPETDYKEWMRSRYEQTLSRARGAARGGTLFRALRVELPSEFSDRLLGEEKAPLGIYWSWDRGNARAYDAAGAGKKVLVGAELLDPSGINWRATLVTNLAGGLEETEITLLEGSRLKIKVICSEGGEDAKEGVFCRCDEAYARKGGDECHSTWEGDRLASA
jgi:hypothetical protein